MAGTTSSAENLAEQMQQTQRQLEIAQAELAETQLTGTAGGGLVTVTMSGSGEVIRVAFDPAVFDDSDAGRLGALTLAAIRMAVDAAKSVATERMTAALGSLRAAQAELGGGLPGRGEAPFGPVP